MVNLLVPSYNVDKQSATAASIGQKKIMDVAFIVMSAFYLNLACAGKWQLNDTESTVLDKLTKGYDKRVMPKPENGGPVHVIVDIYVRSISSIDEISMQFDADLVVRQRWMDKRLSYVKPRSVKNDYISGDNDMANSIWRSDLFLANSKKAYTHDITQPNTLLWIYPNGTVMCNVRISSTFMCQMNLVDYPFDTQRCIMQLGSFGYTEKDIIFFWKKGTDIEIIQVNKAIQLPQFQTPKARTIGCFNPHWTGNFSCLKVEILFTREFGYHMSQSFAPCALLVVCSWVSFWLHVEAIPARTALGVTTFLTIYTQSSGVRYSLPPVSYTKAIDIWFNVCTVFIFLTLVEFALVNYMFRHYSRRETPPPSALATVAENARANFDSVADLEVSAAPPVDQPEKSPGFSPGPFSPGHNSSGFSSQSVSDEQVTNTNSNARTHPRLRARNSGFSDRQRFRQSIRHIKRSMSSVAVAMEAKRKAKTIDVISRILFPIAYVIFIIAYVLMYGLQKDVADFE